MKTHWFPLIKADYETRPFLWGSTWRRLIGHLAFESEAAGDLLQMMRMGQRQVKQPRQDQDLKGTPCCHE